MPAEVVVERVNLEKKFCVTAAGEIYPVTNMVDRFGDETDDAREAMSVVAGEGQVWFTCMVEGLAPTLH